MIKFLLIATLSAYINSTVIVDEYNVCLQYKTLKECTEFRTYLINDVKNLNERKLIVSDCIEAVLTTKQSKINACEIIGRNTKMKTYGDLND